MLLLVRAGIGEIKSDGLAIWGVYAKSIRLNSRNDQVSEMYRHLMTSSIESCDQSM